MKKLCILFICVLAAFMVGCGPQSSADKTVKGFYEALEKQDYNKAAGFMLPSKMIKTSDYAKILKNGFKDNNTIVDYEILGSCNPTNDFAEVAVSYKIKKAQKGSYDKTITTINVIKYDGKWYIDFKL